MIRASSGHGPERALGVGPLQVRLLVGEPLPQPLLGPLAPADRLELLVVPLEVDVPFHEDLLHLADEPDDVVAELGVEAVLGHQLGPLALRLLDRQLVQLAVGVPLELRPGPLVQEQPPVLPHEVADPRAVQDAGRRA